MLHDGLQKLATAGAESVSMLMTICVGASPPPIELARAQPRAQHASRGWVGQVLFSGLAFCLRWMEPYEIRVRFSHSQGIICRGKGGCFRLFFSRYLLTLRVCGSAGWSSNPSRAEPG